MRSRRMPGVVDDDVEVAEGLDRGVDDCLGAVEVGDAVGVGDRLAAGGDDLVDDRLCGAGVGAAAVGGAAEVVDDDLGAQRCEQQRVLTADAAAGAGDDGDSVLEHQASFRYIVTTAAPPRPRLCWSPTVAPSTCRLSASPRSCHVSSLHWAETGGTERVPLRDEAAGRIHHPLAAVGHRARVDEVAGLAGFAQAEGVVGDQFVGAEAVVQLDHVDVFRPEP